MSETGLSIWTLYDHPKDYPDKWVVRRFVIACGVYSHTDDVFADDDLKAVEARAFHDLRMRGMAPVFLQRSPSDDPCIVGVWL